VKIGELFIALGFDVDDKKLKEFNEGIKTGVNELLKMSAIAAGALYSVNKFVSGAVDAATAMRNFTAETGQSSTALEKWRIVSTLKNSAIGADQVTASFKAMSSAISDVEMGKGNSGAFAMLGLNDVRGKSVGQVLEELRAIYKENPAKWNNNLQTTTNQLKDIGFDPGMLQALMESSEDFEKLAKPFMQTEEEKKGLVDLGDAMVRFTKELQRMQTILAADMAPTLIDWMQRAIPLMKDFGLSAHAVANALADMFNSMGPEWQAGVATAAGLLLASWMPVRVMFVGLAAAIDDVGHALRGLPSVSGKALLGYLTLMESEEGSKAAELKRSIVAANPELSYLTDEQLRIKGGKPKGKDSIYPGPMSPKAAGVDVDIPPEMLERIKNKTASWDDLSSLMWQDKYPMPAPTASGPMSSIPSSITQNNTYHIQSTADALDLANQVAAQNQRALNSAQIQQNNGVVY
jgi:hypothetical protein